MAGGGVGTGVAADVGVEAQLVRRRRLVAPRVHPQRPSAFVGRTPPHGRGCKLPFYRVLPGFTGFYRVLPGFTGLSVVGPGFTGFYWVLLGFTGFYRVLPGFTGFYWVLLGSSGINWVKVMDTGLCCTRNEGKRFCLSVCR